MSLKRLWLGFTDKYGVTPIHPQFIINRLAHQAVEEAKIYARGNLIDIGCGRMAHRKILEKSVTKYVGLDHPKLSKLYPSPRKPDIYGDAMKLPVKDATFDTALLLQVLEHLDSPQKALDEAHRVLKKDGYLIVSVPFMYPIHDAPYDYYRFTEHAIKKMLKQSGFKITKLDNGGNFLEFWIQALIVYLFKKVDLNVRKREISTEYIYIFPLFLVVVPLIIVINTFIWLKDAIAPQNKNRPNDYVLNYTVVAQK